MRSRRDFRIAVIEGDLETDNDARRIRAHGVPAVQITTGSACHLDANMIHDALHDLPLSQIDIVFIENVGNLVCPASFDLGQHRNVVLLSATEGDDKPAKYPVMFRAADLVLLTKMDLAAVPGRFRSAARREGGPRSRQCRAGVLAVGAQRRSISTPGSMLAARRARSFALRARITAEPRETDHHDDHAPGSGLIAFAH